MSSGLSAMLLACSVALPLAMLLGCSWAPLRRAMPVFVALAPVPAFLAALLWADAPPLEFGPSWLRLTLALDLPGAILLAVVALLWSAAGHYAHTYLRGARTSGRFFACWLAALTGCIGVFVAADLVTLYAMLAMLTVGATGLVMYDGTPVAWRSAAIYLGLALTAESVLLVGLVMLSAATSGDSLLVRDAVAALPDVPQRDLVLALIVGGLALKAGLVPFHVWMPLAHAAAPVPASSVLSGAVVKVGIIGLIRFLPPDAALPHWGLLLVVAGFVTAFYGVAVGLTQRNPKAVLAYSTVSQMGVVAAVLGMGLGAGDATAAGNAAFYAAHHVLAKGALFLAVGVIAWCGVERRPSILWPAAVLCLGLGGLPFTGGALAKYAVKDQLDAGLVGWLAAASAVGTTWLMLHFLARLAAHAENRSGAVPARAPAGPWLAMAAAAILVPWALYPSHLSGGAGAALAPDALWAAIWPIMLGAALAFLTRSASAHWRVLPLGDIVVALESAGRVVIRSGAALRRADLALRQWTTASLLLVLLVIAFAWTMLPH